jgi:hypothetical protein
MQWQSLTSLATLWDRMTDNPRMRLFWKIAIYYGVCFAMIITAGLRYPEWMNYLPFGGLDALENVILNSNDDNLLDQVLTMNRPVSLFHDAMNLISALAGALLVTIPLRWVYMEESLTKRVSTEVATSLLVLPFVVTTIVYIVKFSLPLAFALTGIFAGVRYSTRLKSQSDAYFTFAAIAVGLSAGTRSLGIAMAMAVFFTLTMIAASPKLGESREDSPSDTTSARL